MSVLHRGAALRLLVGVALAAFSLVAATLPAVAATNVLVSGVIVDANGVPATGVQVAVRPTYSSSTSDANGYFSIPVADGSKVQLQLDVYQSSVLSLTSTEFTISGTTNLGQVQLPSMRQGTIRVLDDAASPVYSASVRRQDSLVLNSSNWSDAGHQLTSALSVSTAVYYVQGTTSADGTLPIRYPRMVTGNLPLPMEARYADADGGVWTADLADATGTDPYTVTMGGFLVTPPSAPQSVQGIGQAFKSGWASVTWGGSRHNGTPATGYTVVASPGGQTMTVPPTQSYVIFEGLTDGVPYTFTVTANSTAGDSAAASSGPVLTLGSPPAPTGVSVIAGDGQATLAWNPVPPPAPITYYRVILFPTQQEFTLPASQTSLTLTGLVNGTNYSAYVRSYTLSGGSEAAIVPGFTPKAPTAPTPTPTPPPPTPTPTPPPTPAPTIAFGNAAKVVGTLAIGSKIRVRKYQATITGGTATYTFQWYADSKKIKKATKASLLVTKAMSGMTLKVKVTAVVGTVTKSRLVKAGRVKASRREAIGSLRRG